MYTIVEGIEQDIGSTYKRILHMIMIRTTMQVHKWLIFQ